MKYFMSRENKSFGFAITVEVLKIRTLAASQKGQDKQAIPRSEPEAVWSGVSLFAMLVSILWIPVQGPELQCLFKVKEDLS